MIPDFVGHNLPPGVHEATWQEFTGRFGYTPHRMRLIIGLQLVAAHLREYGCRRIYVDGSFVTKKQVPADYDCCWDTNGVNIVQLQVHHRVIFDTRAPRTMQKLLYRGDVLPASWAADAANTPYLEFFQKDRMGRSKGIVMLKTEDIP